ncbi:MAG: phosphoribosyltransferase family protein [Saprospiraceae bacterium]
MFYKGSYKKINNPNICLVAPDAGAAKKLHSLAQQINISEIISCEKTRDVSNGKLSGFKVHATDLKNKTCLIIDDICDGGNTFIGIAKELKNKNAGFIYLAISHGIFSDGFDKFKNIIDGIFTTDSFGEIKNNQVDVIGINQIFPFLLKTKNH